MMKRICEGLNQAIKLLYGVTVMIILYLILFRAFFIEYGFKIYFEHLQWEYLLLGIVIWLSLLGLRKIIMQVIPLGVKRYLENRADSIVFGLSIIFGMILIYLVYNYYFYTGWDSETLVNTAQVLATGNRVNGEYENWYFSSFPNNILLVDIFALIIKIASRIGISDAVFSICIVQCVEYIFVGYLVYRINDMIIKNKGVAVQGWLLYLITVGISPWVGIAYSDSIGLIFPILILYIFLTFESGKYIYMKSFFIGFIAWVGYKIKPQVFIVFIAILIVVLFEVMRNEAEAMKIMQRLGCSVLGILVSALLIVGIAKVTPIERNPENSFGGFHFMMMGLNDENNGGYSLADIEYTSAQAESERSAANLAKIKERINNYGLKGMKNHLEKKMLSNYADGTWAWGREGNFYKQCLEDKNSTLSPFLKSIYYQNGSKYHYYQAYAQAMWLLILLGCFIAFIKIIAHKENSKAIMILMLVFLGLTIFELLFEARARYLFSNVPMYIVLANWGLSIPKGNYNNKIEVVKGENNEKRNNSIVDRSSVIGLGL